ncbi:hypothetical protein NLI96_g5821 [Meripilus lineatus]|uniref:Uncharacterized protein n=1 Tax=Meripilus lineatus TaxID=2056292 RepID=A0AAD5V728_9APHY|nr:hypothetical protein NLI96_g5821 [Physisporinus lineatus]
MELKAKDDAIGAREREQAASWLAQETRDRLETVEDDLDETCAEFAELKTTLENDQSACCTLQQFAGIKARQPQSIIDVLRAECSITCDKRDKKGKECDKWHQQFATTTHGLKRDSGQRTQITETRTQLARKQKGSDEVHNE